MRTLGIKAEKIEEEEKRDGDREGRLHGWIDDCISQRDRQGVIRKAMSELSSLNSVHPTSSRYLHTMTPLKSLL